MSVLQIKLSFSRFYRQMLGMGRAVTSPTDSCFVVTRRANSTLITVKQAHAFRANSLELSP